MDRVIKHIEKRFNNATEEELQHPMFHAFVVALLNHYLKEYPSESLRRK